MLPIDWLWFGFVTVMGACVGSFLNVVIYRLPAGKSVIKPPSFDYATGNRLKWYENIPLVSWIIQRGRSRYTGERIGVQYPLVELAGAVIAGGYFLLCYATPWRSAMYVFQWADTWPIYFVHVTLLWGLMAATIIDFRYYLIPLSIPWVCTAVAIVVYPLSFVLGIVPEGVLNVTGSLQPVAPSAGVIGLGASLGGIVGLCVGLALLHFGFIPHSFVEDEPEVQSDDPDEFLAHPHPRREMFKEFLFVGFPLLGLLGGALVAQWYQTSFMRGGPETTLGPEWQSLSGTLLGYWVGAGMIWGTRILGTVGLGKEAMGLGDVHLLGAVGAVIGGVDTVLVFFVAPFLGLAATAVLMLASLFRLGKMHAIPYGPYLAAAAAAMVVLERGRVDVLGILR